MARHRLAGADAGVSPCAGKDAHPPGAQPPASKKLRAAERLCHLLHDQGDHGRHVAPSAVCRPAVGGAPRCHMTRDSAQLLKKLAVARTSHLAPARQVTLPGDLTSGECA